MKKAFHSFYFWITCASVLLIPSSGNSQLLQLVSDINPGPTGSQPEISIGSGRDIVVAGDWFYFLANDGVHGDELWRSNGTETMIVSDMFASDQIPIIEHITAVGNDIYFFAATPQNTGLWKYNGSLLSYVENAPGSFGIIDIVYANSTLYIYVVVGNSERSLFAFDGDSATEVYTSSNSITNICIHQGLLYFTDIWNNENSGLYRCIGTTTELVQTIQVGDSGYGCSYADEAVSAGNNLYIKMNDGIGGCEIWIYDGNSLQSITDFSTNEISSTMQPLLPVGDNLLLSANTSESGNHLYFYNASESNLEMITTENETVYGGSLLKWNDEYYFTVLSQIDDMSGLWKWDENGAAPVTIDGQTILGEPVCVFGNELILWAVVDVSIGAELYTFDGNELTLLHDMNPSGDAENYEAFTEFQGKLYFFAISPEYGSELWSTTYSISSNEISSAPANFRVYPNPTHDNFVIDFGKRTSVQSISVYNVLGERVAVLENFESNLTQISLLNQKTGCYHVVVRTPEKIYQFKLFKI
jgi:ELWxxDGT repeat protein